MLLRINTKASISSYKDILINLAKFRTFVPVKKKSQYQGGGKEKSRIFHGRKNSLPRAFESLGMEINGEYNLVSIC